MNELVPYTVNAKNAHTDVAISIPYFRMIKDGRVAVLYSPGYGAGWSTWAHSYGIGEWLIFDSDLVQAVLDENIDKVIQIATDKAKEFGVHLYCGGASDLTVEWIEVGTAFRITEYDGSESIEYMGKIDYYVA